MGQLLHSGWPGKVPLNLKGIFVMNRPREGALGGRETEAPSRHHQALREK